VSAMRVKGRAVANVWVGKKPPIWTEDSGLELVSTTFLCLSFSFFSLACLACSLPNTRCHRWCLPPGNVVRPVFNDFGFAFTSLEPGITWCSWRSFPVTWWSLYCCHNRTVVDRWSPYMWVASGGIAALFSHIARCVSRGNERANLTL